MRHYTRGRRSLRTYAVMAAGMAGAILMSACSAQQQTEAQNAIQVACLVAGAQKFVAIPAGVAVDLNAVCAANGGTPIPAATN